MSKPSVFVTGAGGFIGRHIVKKMVEKGWFVYALIHKNKPKILDNLAAENKIALVYGDTTNYDSLKAIFENFTEIPDAVIHCAGRASDVGRKNQFYQTNFCSTKYLLQLFQDYSLSRFVYISTTDVYGLKDFNRESETELPFDLKARNYYPIYKIKSEQLIAEMLKPGQYSIIRPAAVWGDDDPTLTGRTIDFLKTTPFIIHFGKWKGKNRWPLVHVNYLAKAVYAATVLDEASGRAINVLESEVVTIEDYYRMILKQFLPGKTLKSITVPLWIGVIFASFVTFISNILNLKQPLTDPSLYALYSISRNLDFSNEFCEELIAKAFVTSD